MFSTLLSVVFFFFMLLLLNGRNHLYIWKIFNKMKTENKHTNKNVINSVQKHKCKTIWQRVDQKWCGLKLLFYNNWPLKFRELNMRNHIHNSSVYVRRCDTLITWKKSVIHSEFRKKLYKWVCVSVFICIDRWKIRRNFSMIKWQRAWTRMMT